MYSLLWTQPSKPTKTIQLREEGKQNAHQRIRDHSP